MPRPSHERRLRKLQQRRLAERRRQRQRRLIAAGVAGVVAIAGIAGLAAVFFGGKSKPVATPSISPGVSPTPTVKPVACGGPAPVTSPTPHPTFTASPKFTIAIHKTYTATFKTSCGSIVVRLLASKSPKTVNSFVFLAKHHFFDGTYFHRISNSIDIFQGGDPTGTGTGGPGYTIPDEYKNGLKFKVGSLAMANTGRPNSGGSQFFFITGPKGLTLPPKYTIFGQIVKSLDIAKRIQAVPVTGETPDQTVWLLSVTIGLS